MRLRRHKNRMLPAALLGLIMVSLSPSVSPVWAIRVKDIASFKGVRPNQLIGNGLVVGLNGTGDGTNVDFNTQELANFLMQLGINAARDKLKVKNIAAVAVTAVLPPFARAGPASTFWCPLWETPRACRVALFY